MYSFLFLFFADWNFFLDRTWFSSVFTFVAEGILHTTPSCAGDYYIKKMVSYMLTWMTASKNATLIKSICVAVCRTKSYYDHFFEMVNKQHTECMNL